MAQFYRPQRGRSKPAEQPIKRNASVSGLDHQGRGIVRESKGVRFIAGALTDELIDFQPQGKWQGKLIQVKQPAPARVTPDCPYYEQCGGCDLQHLALSRQRQHKQQVVSELFAKFAGHDIDCWQAPLTGADWRYRRRLRLACHWDSKRRNFKLGLRQANSKAIVEISDCLISDTALTRLLQPLRKFLPQLDLIAQLGHVELMTTNSCCLLLRLKNPVSAKDHRQLLEFSQNHGVDVWLHCGETAPQPLLAGQELPRYASWQTEVSFQPGDFLQAHGELSPLMVEQALAWLAPGPGDHVLELYAGSGNFSLPIARSGARVTAIEGVPSMVERLTANASRANLSIAAQHADLEQPWQHYDWGTIEFNKVFLDPARAGAAHAISEVAQRQPERVVYVSCAADTLARDARHLFAAGYRLKRAQIVDMFPQTHHIECLTWFERET
ncbi:23S rRNA (uracil(1939)-C(5))-methyltransferase RlmD [Pseudidiomarina terrestris]|uniref:23S rRNA (uracil(1939)-C(5))-methyltransferase RlmD n=1 Tax=Pseudidiomarina terrestris TaxID=2820060 RepID=UPI002656F7D4|nr:MULTISPECIES: 23S rRNA (uracil(1939)-C(5))-methyltransferase RlmD [unclassified Pseudidiomarina]MDN7135054.1 23S rRNA (uracil(1939)-C(5))-methyltransferase RlmD [Pseudidiomarina sp. 1ASP75-5]MEA3587167.1 23S rRNA (uracil(1939)-C(5))-methyltransferase RlmD [Pseudidiomarina sp. 1APP75-27a]